MNSCPHGPPNRVTERRLPHVYPEGAWLFVTWHLHGSFPRAMYPPPGKPSAGRAFVWMDRRLDTARQGPMSLRQPAVAAVVAAALRRGCDDNLYELRAFAVMPNHVHVLFRPLKNPSKVLQWLKGKTARDANQILAQTGKTAN